MASLSIPRLLILAVLLMIWCALGPARGEPDLTVCDPSNYTYPYVGPPLPTLPNQYRLKVEGSITNKGYAVVLEEFYDEINNRGASVSRYGNHTYYTSYDYGLNQTVTVMMDAANGNSSCTVSDLSSTSFNLYGFHVENGTGHVNGTDAVFRFGPEYNETYVGMATVRGVPANRWQRCIYDAAANHTLLLDFYFSDPGFRMPYGASQVPLRATVNGSAFNKTTGERRTFYHNYEYVEVQPGPVALERAFEPPLGVLCPGYKRVKSFPPIPDVFSVSIEAASLTRKALHFIKENYNYKGKLVSYVYLPWNRTSGNSSGQIKEVHDYNIGLSYKIDYDMAKCTIGPIPVHSYFHDAESEDGQHVQLRSPFNFLLHEQADWIYEGNTTVRGVDAEAWITRTQFNNTRNVTQNHTMEYYFARNNWTGDGRGLGLVHQMPLMVKFTGRTLNGSMYEMIQHMYQFSPDVSHHMMDVHECFNGTDSRILAVDVVGSDNYQNYVVNNSNAFFHATQHALANASGLPLTRIANLYAAEGTEKLLTIYFEMLGLPPIKGNAVNMSSQPSLTEGFVRLEESSLAETPIVIRFMKGDRNVTLALLRGSLRASFHPSYQGDNQGLSAGAAAGVGVSMFVLGILIASGIAYFYIKRVRDPPVPYGVQN